MKKTPIDFLPIKLPKEVESLTRGSTLYDSSCSPEARVYYARGATGYYLKAAKPGTLAREAEMNAYFHTQGIGPEVIYYGRGDECDLLVTKEVCGDDCTTHKYLSSPKRLAALLGRELRKLHERDTRECPRQGRLDEYFALAEENYRTDNYDKNHFPDSFGYRCSDEAYKVFKEGKHLLRAEVLIHGDFCLPNIMLDEWDKVSYIDLGNAGVADRHIDLFWGAWTLWFNLGTNDYRDIFFDAYGRELIDEERLRVVAAIEVFG